MPAMISHEEFQVEPAGSACPLYHNGPTPLAMTNAQIIHANMPNPHQVHTTRNGSLNFSGRISKNGVERNQNTTKPTNSYVVVGMVGPNVFGIRAKEGQMAVMQTATSLPPFQPVKLSVNVYASETVVPTLNSVPDKVQENTLQKWDIAPSHTP